MKSLRLGFIFLVLSLACLGQSESLLIGPGDTLHVQIFDTPEMDQHPKVTDSGEIPLLFAGNVKVAKLSPAEAAAAIGDALKAKQIMLHPQVSVTVELFATQQVSILGQLKTPGTYPLTTGTPILRVLSLAGGITELADRNISIERHAEPGKKINYYLSNTSDDAIANQVIVYPGDTILVPKVGVVYVLGDVGRPGGYPLSTNDSHMTILQAVALAGTLNKTALLSKAKLIRKTPTGLEDVPIQLGEIEKGKQPDVVLQANDIVYIPFSWMKNVALASSSIGTSATTALIYAAHP
jgi:polysaccharide export outer membrane protein